MKVPKDCEGCLTATERFDGTIYCSDIVRYKNCPCSDCIIKGICQSVCDKYREFNLKRIRVKFKKGDLYSDTT